MLDVAADAPRIAILQHHVTQGNPAEKIEEAKAYLEASIRTADAQRQAEVQEHAARFSAITYTAAPYKRADSAVGRLEERQAAENRTTSHSP